MNTRYRTKMPVMMNASNGEPELTRTIHKKKTPKTTSVFADPVHFGGDTPGGSWTCGSDIGCLFVHDNHTSDECQGKSGKAREVSGRLHEKHRSVDHYEHKLAMARQIKA